MMRIRTVFIRLSLLFSLECQRSISLLHVSLPWRSRAADLSLYAHSGEMDQADRMLLQHRIEDVKLKILEEEWRRPPNRDYTPETLIEEILAALWNPDFPTPDSGFRLLLATATKEWRTQILQSIGVPATKTIDLEVAVSALGAAIGRPDNQFAILVSDADNEDQPSYFLDFPNSSLEYGDGTAWMECHFRDKKTNDLLVVSGWNLKQNDDEAWLVHSIIWYDLRDKFRPGIGQTEWMRIYR